MRSFSWLHIPQSVKRLSTREIIQEQAEHSTVLCNKLPPEQWAVYREVMLAASEAHIPFAVGGGIAAMAYADQSRDSKDLDLYIVQDNRPAMIDVLTRLGFVDYYDQKPYERHWIYRAFRDGTIVDVMWSMANRRGCVDSRWLRGPMFCIDDLHIRLLPPEEILWTKLYVLQRDRSDWTDALNMLYVVGGSLNWNRLFDRVGEDIGLLAGLVAVFRWLAPGRAGNLPSFIWRRLQIDPPAGESAPEYRVDRARLLDTRPWFTPMMDEEHRLTPSHIGEDKKEEC